MDNYPDGWANHPDAPWNEKEWHCPECGGNEQDVECTPDECKESEDE